MDSKTVKIAAGGMVTLAVVMGIFAYQTSNSLTQAPAEVAVAPEPPVQALTMGLVAVKPIAAYQIIKPEDVEMHPLAVVPPGYFSDASLVVGRAPITGIDVGVPVTGRYFGNVSPLAQSIPPDHKAIALRIDEVVAVGSFVRPGDIVDVLLYVRGGRSEGTDTETQSRVLLRSARVLAFEEQLLAPPVQNEDDAAQKARANSGRRIQTVVVAVPEFDITRVMLGASLGELRLALHGGAAGGAEMIRADANDADYDGIRPRFASFNESDASILRASLSTANAKADGDQVITLKELTALDSPHSSSGRVTGRTIGGSGRTTQRKPAAASNVVVHRGTETNTVSYDGIVLK